MKDVIIFILMGAIGKTTRSRPMQRSDFLVRLVRYFNFFENVEISMSHFMPHFVRAIFLSALSLIPFATSQAADVARGKYLVSIAGCNDCHTPGYFFGKPDAARFLGGSDVGFEIPGLGVFHGPNLTPDKETGLGNWTDAQIVTAFTTGKRPDGRELAPVMPWRAFANFSKEDVNSIVAYLRTLPSVQNKTLGPYSSTEQSHAFVMRIVPGGQKP